jgi:putative RecB family exonuclease
MSQPLPTLGPMPLELPSSLSPSKVSSFTECALAFRFSAIDRLPDPPTVATVKGTLVHAALERLLLLPPADRTPEAATRCLAEARTELADDPELLELGLDADGEAAMAADAATLLERYFALEDPRQVRPIGLELKLDTDVDGLRLRGIIDRLELDDQGELVVTDYKTGRSPGQHYEQSRLNGVHFYAFLCERVLGRRPARVQLLYLADGVAIQTVPTDQSIRALERKVRAIWAAIERACEREDFRPRTSRLCDYCAFQAWCPAFGGDPDEARRVAAELADRAAVATGALTDGAAIAMPVPSPG